MKDNLKKIIIPVAGLGTRMLPATKAIPKEMLPIVNKPIIQYVVEEAVNAGFKEVILITHSSKSSIENHFDTSFELESVLEKRVKRHLLKEIKSISKLNVQIHSIRQGEAKGLGHAILCAKSIIGKEPFAVSLPDMLIENEEEGKNLSLMKKYFDKAKVPSILLAKVAKSDTRKYGIAKLKKSKEFHDFEMIEKIVEKPNPKNAPSKFCAVGRYIFNNDLMTYLAKVKPDSSGEIQLTNAIDYLIKDKKLVLGLKLEGNYFDCGEKLGFLKANLAFAKKDPALKKDLLNFLKNE